MRTRRGAALTVTLLTTALLTAGALTGCGGGTDPRISATPTTALYDTPFTTTVTGLDGGSQATLRATSTDTEGVTWSASATFRADGSGRFSTAQAPIAGDYATADPMGLVENLSPGTLGATFSLPQNWTIRVTLVVEGKDDGHVDLTRQFPSQLGVRATPLRPDSGGLYGTLFEPARTPATPSSAVVVFGGSEGGLSSVAQASLLAAHGHPALALAYFAEPGLPANLENIPLEYFASAAQYLTRQPDVDPAKVVLWGTSRGSEAALLTAAYRPDLVHGVIGAVPGAEAFPGLPDSTQAAWTWNGAPVATESDVSYFRGQSAERPATIPVERIDGPLLLVCGGSDRVWNSCGNVDVITQRLTDRGVTRKPTELRYPDSGHGVGPLVPYLPSTATTGRPAGGQAVSLGGTYEAVQAARAQGWPAALAWLGSV